MPIRLSGLISGLDTDSLVKELVSAYSTKKDKYVKQKTKLEWTQEKWKSLNTKTYSFYTSKLSNMRFSTNYSKKTVTISDSTKATVSGSSAAVNGTQELQIKQLAKTGYLTGAELQTDGKKASYTGDSKLSDLGVTDSGSISVKVDGKEHTFEISADTTINNVISQLKTAGLHASFDENNQRFFISSKTSGGDHDFAMTGDANGITAMQKMGIYKVSNAEKNYYSELANESDNAVLAKAQNEYLSTMVGKVSEELTTKNKELQAKHDYLASYDEKDKALTESIESNTKAMNEKLNVEGNKLSDEQKYKLLSDIKEGKITKDSYEGMGTLTSEDKSYLKAYYELSSSDQKTMLTYAENNAKYLETQKQYEEYKEDVLGVDDTVDNDKLTAKISELAAEITANSEKLETYAKLKNTSYTEETVDHFTTDTAELKAAYEKIVGKDKAVETFTSLQKKYEDIRTQAKDIVNGNVGNQSNVSRVNGQDAEINLNGATFVSNTNNFAINGLTITALGVTAADEKVSVTTADDVDGIYNMVKDFFKSYNELMTEMQTAYNADSAKGYDPLTDDEKEAMSDDEVEKWETKIKDALLRRDDTLGNIMTAMQSAMSQSVTVDGKSYTLSTFGIATGSYFSTDAKERGCYHIDGDPDDSTTSGNVDKLKAAIAKDPDTFVQAFSQISKNLYDALTKKMARTSLSSSYTIYNDKYMDTQKTQLEKTISSWEEKISDYEEKYYKQFSSMETAMSKLQSSTSSLSSLLGS